jgi:uncharacterized protein
VAIIVLVMQRPTARRRLTIVAAVGRMPLTAYIAQSIICTFVFYGWGLGWAGKVHSAGCVAFAFVVFAFEVAGCHLWLRWFHFGPLEWIWRALVYQRLPAMRVTARPRRPTRDAAAQ